jgi:hypothetical protein
VRRWLFNILTALSLLLCVATVVMWVRSYQHEDWVLIDRRYITSAVSNAWPPSPGRLLHSHDGSLGMLRYWGVDPTGKIIMSAPFPVWFMPYFLLVLPPLIFPAVWLAMRWRRRQQSADRTAMGLCTGCGYDLRASIERCPECGTPIPPDIARRPIK